MSITISKRTRATVEDTWSSWTETTADLPPFSDTDLVQYKIGNIDFESKFLASYSNLLAASVGDGTPYKTTLDFLDDNFDNEMLKAQVMSSITTTTTNNAMQFALNIANKELRITSEIAILENQKYISDETKELKVEQLQQQVESITQNALFTKEKIDQLIKAAKDNNRIQAQQIIGEFFAQYKLGGGTLSEDMFKLIFEMAIQTYNNTDSSITMTSDLSTS